MKVTRSGKRRAAAINSVKVLLTSASLAATLGGWAAISAVNGSSLQVAQLDPSAAATATVQAWLASRSTTTTTNTTANTTPNTTTSTTPNTTTSTAANTTANNTTVAATATPVPTQAIVVNIRTRSSK